jgi:hypothetical protein
VDWSITVLAAAGPLVSTTVSATAKPTTTAPTPIPAGRRHHGLPPDAPDPDRPGGSDGGPAGGIEEPDPPAGAWPTSEAPPVGPPDSGPEGGPDGPCAPSRDEPEGGPEGGTEGGPEAGGGGGRRPAPLDGGGAGG